MSTLKKTAAIHVIAMIGAALSIAMGLLSNTAHAGAIEELQNFNKNFKTASGYFTQHVKGKNTQSSSGSFTFSRPGKFRWTYDTPYEQVLVSNGKTLSIYDKDLQQVTTRTLGNAIESSPAAVLFGSSDLSKNFILSDGGERDGQNWVHAKPRAQSNFESIQIGMKNGMPETVVLFDHFGQTTTLLFSGVQKNSNTPANTFVFKAPAGTRHSKQ